MLDREGEIGTLAIGARADLVVLAADPRQDLAVLADPARQMPLVVQGGAIVRDGHRTG
ncbi:hypothetical protein [Embleya sp. NPDC020886]|uniref:hypothetical protein n=1 Tax=Embleya sp. NPDC020886 TaxID=3363980 RepID=UPI0037BC6400